MSDGNGPPVLIGEKVWWLGSGSGLPKRGVVRWIGRLPEIGPDWALGIELEEGLPYGGVDGTWRGRQLFKCKPKHGLIVPSDRVLAHQSGAGVIDVKTRKDVSLLPLQNQVSAPPRLRRNLQERSLLLDRHSDFRSVHLEAVQIRRRIQQDQVVSLVLGQTSASPGDVFLPRGMTRNEAAVVPRARRTESLAARKEKTNSGLFSFLRWFRRENKTDRGEERSSFSNPGSPVLRRSDSAITGSVDTLFSTATATSFAYVRPESYRPFGEADEPEKWIFPGPETKTYKNRIKRRDELGRLNKNLSLREKYNLYASGSLGRSLDEFFDDRSLDSLDRLQPIDSCSSTLARKKRQAPVPPPLVDSLNSPGCDSLPTTLSKESLDDFKLHRRTVSESAKYKKKPYHVKGKRKAPPPPKSRSHEYEDLNCTNTSRKKRKAPPPPIELHKGNVVNIPKEAALDVIEDDKLKIEYKNDSGLPSTSKSVDQEVESVSSTDTLRLEKGILKPNKMDKGFMEPKPAPTSPVSPRPWYKRPQSSGPSPKQNDLKKKENKSIEDWMLESGFPRRSQGLPSDSKGNIFNKSERPEDKRRSQISILTNISELDREAAEIIQRGKEREKSLLASYNAKYYVDSGESSKRIDEGSQTDAVPKKATAKELISLFNSITNISRITVNSNFVAKEDIFLKNGEVSKSITHESKLQKDDSDEKTVKEILNGYSKVRRRELNVDEQVPGPSGVQEVNGKHKLRGIFSSGRATSLEESKISKVTIEELDEYDSEKSQSSAVIEEKKKAINPPLNGPVITEVTDSSMKSSSGSTICSSLLNDSSSSLSSGSSSGAKIKSSQLFSNYPLQKKISMWTCSRCTLENPRWRLTCEACDMWRPTVCDYKLCKKPATSDQVEEINAVEIKTGPQKSKPKLSTETSSKKVDKMLDNETINLIRNGQILANLSSQRASSRNGDQDNSKVISSPKLAKKQMAISTGLSNDKDSTDELKIISNSNNSATNSIPGSSSNDNNADPEQTDVVRKARLAFFSKADTISEKLDGSVNTDSESVNNMDNISKETTTEKLKLRELLKEMKNSLPKQKKLHNSTSPLTSNASSLISNSPKGKSIIMKQNSFNESSTSITATKPILVCEQENLRPGSSRDNYGQNDVQDILNKGQVDFKLADAENKSDPETKKFSFLTKSINGEHEQGLGSKIIISKNDASSNKTPVIVDAVAKASSSIPTNIETARKDSVEDSTTKIDIKNKVLTKSLNLENELKNQPTETSNVPSEKKAEAIFVKSKIIVEEIKVRKKPEKVSSSAQTSTKVLSLDDSSKGTVKNEEVVVPVTAEEYILKDGSIASSLVRTEPMKLDVKKFELMRPRDFNNVINSGDEGFNSANNLQQCVPTPSTSSSSSSVNGFNLPVEPVPGTSSSKGDVNAVSMGTVALNRLLKKLEAAIAGGQHDAAAGLAKELALLKVPCSVVRHSPTNSGSSDILMKVLIEDKTSQKGPISMRVKPWVKLADLKRKMEKEHDIPAHLQRWFIDKKLASDDQNNVRQLGIEGPSTPIFLYYIAQDNADVTPEQQEEKGKSKTKILNTSVISEGEQEKVPYEVGYPSYQTADSTATLPSNQSLGWRCNSCNRTNKREEKKCGMCGQVKIESSWLNAIRSDGTHKDKPAETPLKGAIRDPPREEPRPSTSYQAEEREKQENYKKLVDLEKDELVLSVVSFECPVCFIECKPPDGVVLKECLHSFCKACLSKTVEYSEEPEVKCPYRDDTYTCDSTLLEREIKALVTPEVYEEHLAKSIAQAETKIANAFHCKTPDCKGWCIYEDNVNLFRCPVCLHSNCLTCQAIHEGLNCKQYQEQLSQESEVNLDAKRTKDMLQEMVDRGEAMVCPRCKVVLMKKWGCDWLRCSMCKTEICWVTRGPRWGPNGKGDTSGGCQCGVNGVKCHPKCNYCH